MPSPRPPVGLLPAAGRGLRFGASGYAKELFPLLLEGDGDAGVTLRPICELALRAMSTAGAERCVTVTSKEKVELLRVLGGGESLGVSLAYVLQPEPAGLPDVVRTARAWLGDDDVVFAMPDTVVLPRHALADVYALLRATNADLVLGVFPADEPERLGPVAIDANGAVTKVYDKPEIALFKNTWGVASWTARFTAFACAREEARRTKPRVEGDREPVLGDTFEAARDAGLSVRALFFPEGRFVDVGTPKGLRAALGALAESGDLVAAQATPVRATP